MNFAMPLINCSTILSLCMLLTLNCLMVFVNQILHRVHDSQNDQLCKSMVIGLHTYISLWSKQEAGQAFECAIS